MISTHIYNIEVTDAGPLGEERRKRIVEILAEGIYASLKAEGKFDKESVCKQEEVGPLDKDMYDSYNYIGKIIPFDRGSNAKKDHDHTRGSSVLLPFRKDPRAEKEEPESDPRVVDPNVCG